MNFGRNYLKVACLPALLAVGVCLNQGAVAQDLTSEATTLCSVATGALISGQVPAQQVLGQQALQIALQQTGGTGIYQQLRNMGPAVNYFISNPHFDQDAYLGQIFHTFCTSQHQGGLIQWNLKFAPSTQKIEFFEMNIGQPQSPQANPVPQPVPVTPPKINPQPEPEPVMPDTQSGPQAAPSKEEACQMFPGMC